MNQPPPEPQGYAYPAGEAVPPGPPRGKVRPGRAWYLLALAIVAGGVAWLVLSFTSFAHQVDSMPRVSLAGVPTGSDLAFGPSLAGAIVKGIVGGILLIVLGVVDGVVFFVVRIVRRRRQFG